MYVLQQDQQDQQIDRYTHFLTMTTIITNYIQSLGHILEDVRREVLCEVLQTLKTKGLLNEEIEHVFTTMTSPPTVVKKTRKEKKPRFSAYHLFMKEHRVVVKREHPGIKPQVMTSIVSKAWKDVSEEHKEELRIRALQMKEEYNLNGGATKSVSTKVVEIDQLKEEETKCSIDAVSAKKQKHVSERQTRVNVCVNVLKERFGGVKKKHLLAAARLMSEYLKQNGCLVVNVDSTMFETALTYSTNKVNKLENHIIYELPREEEEPESELDSESEDEEESELEEEEEMGLASESDESDDD